MTKPAANDTANSETTHLQRLLDDRLHELRMQITENRRVRALNDTLRAQIVTLHAEIEALRNPATEPTHG